ncbi:MAG TPA: FkbM family methyltransferase [Candidatus Nitrosocosmicus sp.]
MDIKQSIKNYIKARAGVPDMFSSLKNLKRIGFKPLQIVDVGAYQGEWTKNCLKIFPEANYLMVEGMEIKKPFLEDLNRYSNISYEIALLGASTGKEVYFSEIETASSVLEEVVTQQKRTKKVLATLDDILIKHSIRKVDLLKLDVQGYELEILKGYERYFDKTEVILSEVSLLDIHKNCPLIKDILNEMYKYGFVAYDICSATRRPLDNALWQTDILFVKEESIYRNDKRYQL